MRCKTCDYPLWQIKDRQCPECGTAFKPSEFEFNLNSVRFHCPHCDQVYYGTGPQGQLVPKSFTCVSCSTPVDMDDMVLRPADNVTENQTIPPSVPWIDARPRNPFARFFGTMGMGIGNPNRLIEGVPEGSSPGRAFAYGAIHVILQMALSGSWFVLGVVSIGIMSATGTSMGWGIAGVALVLIITTPLVLLLWTGLIHLVLKLTGPTAGGFGRTLHATCYSAGNNFLTAIPCLSMYIAWAGSLWWTITAGFMLARAQKVSGVRAGFAVAAPLVLIGVLFAGGIVALVYTTQSQIAASMATAGVTLNSSNVSRLASTLSGALPVDHVAELAANDQVMFYEMFDATDPGNYSRQSTWTVGGQSISRWYSLTPREKTAAATAAIKSISRGTVAYRIGDVVFTHHGIQPTNIPAGDPANKLWTLVLWPENLKKKDRPSRGIDIGLADGTTIVTALKGFDDLLAQQNTLRASVGLPPLNHPADVTRNAPQVATQTPTMVIPAGGTPPPPVVKIIPPDEAEDAIDPDLDPDEEPETSPKP